MAATYRVAVIGRTGRGDYGHGIDVVWKSIPQATIVAVADDDEKGRTQAVARLGVEHAYADYREMLDKQRPQIVSIAPRWPDCHRDMVLACAEYGCHMFIEKPLSPTLQDADAMVAACEAKHLKMAIAHQTRYSPCVERVKELIEDGKLGDLLELRGRGKEDQRGGGQDLMVLGTHIMDLIRFIAGDPQWCFARVMQAGKPVTASDVREGDEKIGLIAGDELHAMYGLKSPGIATFDSHKARHGVGERWGLRIFGSRGIIAIGRGSAPTFPDVYFIEDPSWSPGSSKAQWVPVTSGGLGKPETEPDTSPQTPGNIRIVKDLIHAIETDTQPRGNMYDGRAALEMILAVYESQRVSKPVPLPLRERTHPLELFRKSAPPPGA